MSEEIKNNNIEISEGRPKKKKRRIIDNKAFYAELVSYIEDKKINPNTKMKDSLGKFFMILCTHLGTKGNFSGYPFRSDMESEAAIECIRRVDNFNPEKYNNPHAYFSTIAFNSFIRRIKKEKADLANRIRYIGTKMVDYNLESEIVGTPEITDEMNNFLKEYDEAQGKQK